jgi:CheY-like chemotaxis protein
MLLDNCGYEVLSAVDGEDAVQKSRENRDRIKLLLFDVHMPKRNGIVTYDEIMAVDAGMKVVFTCGYAYVSKDAHRRAQESTNVAWLPKQYLSTRLFEMVQRMLG